MAILWAAVLAGALTAQVTAPAPDAQAVAAVDAAQPTTEQIADN